MQRRAINEVAPDASGAVHKDRQAIADVFAELCEKLYSSGRRDETPRISASSLQPFSIISMSSSSHYPKLHALNGNNELAMLLVLQRQTGRCLEILGCLDREFVSLVVEVLA